MLVFSLLIILEPPSSPLFPYTTLFRSARIAHRCRALVTKARGQHLPAFVFIGRCHYQHVGNAAQVGEIEAACMRRPVRDRKSTRPNSSHMSISYAVFCLKKKIILDHMI